MNTTTYLVDGMTCEHCVRAVTDEVGAIHGVTQVTVGLVVGGSSGVTVTSDAQLSEADVAEAVDEAGYVMAGAQQP